jgi:hypothetical protein
MQYLAQIAQAKDYIHLAETADAHNTPGLKFYHLLGDN